VPSNCDVHLSELLITKGQTTNKVEHIHRQKVISPRRAEKCLGNDRPCICSEAAFCRIQLAEVSSLSLAEHEFLVYEALALSFALERRKKTDLCIRGIYQIARWIVVHH